MSRGNCSILGIASEVVRECVAPERTVHGADNIGELGGQGTGIDRVERLAELLLLGHPEDHGIPILPVEGAVERRPSQRRGVSIDPELLRCFDDLGHGGVDGGLPIEATVRYPRDVLAHLVSMVERY